jgi:hypothetical protein
MSQSAELLAEAGFSLDGADPEQVAVLESLSDDELRVLAGVKARVDAAGSDVEGHDSDPGGSFGGMFW